MRDLGNWANIAEIIGVIIVIGGLMFAVLQMRQTRQQRREMAAIELFRFFGNPKFAAAYKRVLRLPDGLTGDEIDAGESGLGNSAMLIAATLESIGVMTYQRIVPFAVVRHLIGASGPMLWVKLEPWVTVIRDEQAQPALFEWFQWLAERLAEDRHAEPVPAYLAYKGWLPSNLTSQI